MGRTLSYEELIFVNCIIENSTTNMKITWCRLAVWPNKKVGSRTTALSWSHILLARYCPAKQPKVHTKLYLKISWSWHLLLAGLQSCPKHQWQRFENQTTSTENHGFLIIARLFVFYWSFCSRGIVCTVKLGDKEEIGVKEPFLVTNC